MMCGSSAPTYQELWDEGNRLRDREKKAETLLRNARHAMTCPMGSVANFKLTESISEIDYFLAEQEPKTDGECEWQALNKYHPRTYKGACNSTWVDVDGGGPAHNDIRFCPRCGKPIHISQEPKTGGKCPTCACEKDCHLRAEMGASSCDQYTGKVEEPK